MDRIDRHLLYYLDIDSRRPVKEIATYLDEKSEKINYRLNRLLREGVINRFYCEVNPWKVGFTSFKVYLQFQGVDRGRIDEMYEFLRSSCNINWVASCLGRWDMVIEILAHDRHEFRSSFSRFHKRYSRYILSKVIGVTVEMAFMNKKWLCPEDFEANPTIMGGHPEMDVDDKDLAILRHLIKRGRDPIRQIADELGMPQTTISQRINRMIEREVLGSFRVDIDLGRFDRVFCKSFVYFAEPDEQKEKELLDYCLGLQDVVYVNKIIAPWELEIDAHVPSFNDFTALMNDLTNRFPTLIRNFEAVIINKGTGSFHTIPPKSR